MDTWAAFRYNYTNGLSDLIARAVCHRNLWNKQQNMYRYCVDNAVIYTSEDIVLFRDSPFASWMERLTLENPEHAISPDTDSAAPVNPTVRQDELAGTLETDGKTVVLIDWDWDEPTRRTSTLGAMRAGVDFIVNAQLALGSLSEPANLLMRTSGYSELGNYLYVPCDTQTETTINAAFRLSFLADLLHSLQGQLPPQMLIIRGNADLVPLRTEDHVYHYNAVKTRFMETMRTFRKHRLPDPVESSHFGRWSECANEVLRQRALREQESELEHEVEHEVENISASAEGRQAPASEAVDAQMHDQMHDTAVQQPAMAAGGQLVQRRTSAALGPQYAHDAQARVMPAGQTLAEQASLLPASSPIASSSFFRRGSTVEIPRGAPEVQAPLTADSDAHKSLEGDSGFSIGSPQSDVALQDLAFIGSRGRATGTSKANTDTQASRSRPRSRPVVKERAASVSAAPLELKANSFPPAAKPRPKLKPHPLDSADVQEPASAPLGDSGVDMDAVSASLPPAGLTTSEAFRESAPEAIREKSRLENERYPSESDVITEAPVRPAPRPFDSTLMTSEPFLD